MDMTGSRDIKQPHTHLDSVYTFNEKSSLENLQSFNGDACSSIEDAMTEYSSARRTQNSRPGPLRSHLPSRTSLSAEASHISTSTSQFKTSNKLVKRSPSSHALRLSSTLGKRDSNRRPYTSHQRDFLQLQSGDAAAAQDAVAAAPVHHSPRLNAHSPHFSTPRIPWTVPTLSSLSGPPFIRRISPDGRYPSLVTRGAGSDTDIDLDGALDQLVLGEFPSSKSSPSATPSFSFSSSSPQVPTYSTSSNDRGPRRAFSFSKILNRKSTDFRRGPDSGKTSAKLLRKTSRRLFSAPETSKIMPGAEEGERPTKKRGGRSRSATSNVLQTRNLESPESRPATADSQSPPSESRPSRLSATPSELTSSQVGSDTGTGVFSSADEDDLDIQSDTVYDSMRTGMTKNSSAFRSPRLESLFDKPDDSLGSLEDSDIPKLSHDAASSTGALSRGRRGTSEEGESASTPARTIVGSRRDSRTPGSPRTAERSSSPSSFQPNFSLGAMPFPRRASDEEFNWSDSGDWDKLQESPTPHHATKTLAWLDKSTPTMARHGSPSASESATRSHEAKINPFDWSEHPTPSAGDSPPRPKTEYGKKAAAETRASRPSGRAPSGFHARSTSVPVVPDVKTKVTNKFGTWGIGSKGVSEDWDDDFAFELPSADGSETSEEVSRPNTATTMHVPLGIREAQVNVVANISLVREWGLLIEELKELRARAITLGVPTDEHTSTFEEVDAMIELADLDHEDGPEEVEGSRGQSPFTSSPRFSFDDIDENTPVVAAATPSPLRMLSKPDGDDVFQSPSAVMTPPRAAAAHSHAGQASGTRPRKNSEAVALSVIEELHRRRGAADPKINRGPKMEFDTATLKNIVPYVNGLMRQFKEILRNAEGLATTPKHKSRRSEDPAFSQAFIEPGSPASPTAKRGRRNTKRDKEVDELGHGLKGGLNLT